MKHVGRPIFVQHVDDLHIRSVARLSDHQSFSKAHDLRVWSPRPIHHPFRVGGRHPMVGDVPLVPVVPTVSHAK